MFCGKRIGSCTGYDVVGLDHHADKRFDEETIKKLEEIS